MTPAPWYYELGQRLRKARRNAGLSQTELAHHLGMTRGNVACMETGRQAIPARHLATAATHLRVDPGWLLTGYSHEALPPVVIDPRDLRRQADALMRLADELNRTAHALRELADTTTPNIDTTQGQT